MSEYWFLPINWYILIAYWFYSHNRNMGEVWTGTIVALLWWIVVIMWCFGWYFEWKEERYWRKYESNR